MGWLGDKAKDAAKGAAKKGAGAAKDAAVKRLSGTHKVQHLCCGQVGKHLNGCNGEVDAYYKGKSHSGHQTFSAKGYRQFVKDGGTSFSATPAGNGNFIVHVKSWPGQKKDKK